MLKLPDSPERERSGGFVCLQSLSMSSMLLPDQSADRMCRCPQAGLADHVDDDLTKLLARQTRPL
jgi:hypothetical protein